MDTAPLPLKPAKKAKKKSQKMKSQKKKRVFYSPLSGPKPEFKQFNILPVKAFAHPRLEFLMSFFTKSVKQQEQMLELWRKKPFSDIPHPFYTPPDALDAFWSPSLVKGIEESLALVRRSRFLFRKLLQAWRFRKLRSVNSEDPVTLYPPKQSVWIVDWHQKSKYVFEASTLMRDITMRLLEHDGFFEDPQSPRNPFTNIPLTQSQMISVWNQLSSTSIYPSAVFSEFRRVRFNIATFFLEYATPLQLHAFRQTMRDPTHIDYQERLIDFIEYAYDQESIDCYVQSYKYAMEHYSDHGILTTWAKLCTEFYEASIVYSKNTQKIHQIQEIILDKTTPLLPRQDELRLLRNADIRLQRSIHHRRAPVREVVYQREVTVLAGRTVEEAAQQISELLNALL